MCTPRQKKLCTREDCDLCFNRSFLSHPRHFFFSELNNTSTRQLCKNSTIKYIFNCDICPHSFESTLACITRGQWCPYCDKKLCNDINCEMCFEKSFESHPKSEFWSNLNELLPREVTKTSGKKMKFDCIDCKHVFEMMISNIKNSWCHFCSNDRLCDDINCSTCFEKSFASNPKSIYWNNENELIPRQVFKCSSKSYKFNCNECNHTFTKEIHNVKKESWCPYCASELCEDNDCVYCFNRSFACHPKSEFWSELNDKTPRQVTKSSKTKQIFICDKCPHIFESQLAEIFIGVWCPYCDTKLCEDDRCEMCFNKSFASHPKSIYWNNKNILLPMQVSKYSNKKYFFNCDICSYIFETRANDVSNGTWCPKCVNKTELVVYNYLLETHKELIREGTFIWCKKINLLRFDFVIDNLKLILEIDGCQHFKQVSNWKSPEYTRKNDIYKMKCAFENGYSILRIQQSYIYENKIDWKSLLKTYIKQYKDTIVFIGDSRYNQHIINSDFTDRIIIHLIE
jgi:very-short-patch-repair endonuclease